MPRNAPLFSRPAVALLRGGAVAVLLSLAACAGQQPISGGQASTAPGQLYARGLDDIRALFIDEVPLKRVALSGAAHLTRLDNRISINDSFGTSFGDALSVSYDGHDVGLLPMPSGNDAAGWGQLIVNAVALAKQASPVLAAAPEQAVDRAVFHGMTAALDRFSRYSAPDAARDLRAARDGFGGIGVSVDTSERLLRVSAVSPHSPAERAGIRPEDQIVAINGIATAGCSQEDAIHQLRGPIGSAIALRVLHPGSGQQRELQLQRAFVVEPTVTMNRDGNIAVFRVASFNHSTTQRIASGIAEAQRSGPLAGIVLDLRNDPGGLLDQAVAMADLFVDRGPIVSTVGRHPASYQYFAASGKAIAPHVPIVVLINGGSASASEIVAAALQDAGRAVVIGSSSYGKGTVQTVMRLPNDGELTLTWARLVTPSGYVLQTHGVVPTICTADLPDDPAGLQSGLARAAAATGAVRRAGLDEHGWAALRGSCPGRRATPAIDLALAERLLADPQLYAAALRALPADVHFAAAARRDLP